MYNWIIKDIESFMVFKIFLVGGALCKDRKRGPQQLKSYQRVGAKTANPVLICMVYLDGVSNHPANEVNLFSSPLEVVL